MKSRRQDNDIEIYLQIIFADRFLRTSKNKIYKCMTSVSKNVYTDMSQKGIKDLHTSDISFSPKLIGDYQFKKNNLKEYV